MRILVGIAILAVAGWIGVEIIYRALHAVR
jgi:hypothetical protein